VNVSRRAGDAAGTREDRLLPTEPLNLAGLPVHRMALGAYHTLLVTTNGELISFGAGGPEPQLDTVRELMDNDGVSIKLKGGERGRLCEVRVVRVPWAALRLSRRKPAAPHRLRLLPSPPPRHRWGSCGRVQLGFSV